MPDALPDALRDDRRQPLKNYSQPRKNTSKPPARPLKNTARLPTSPDGAQQPRALARPTPEPDRPPDANPARKGEALRRACPTDSLPDRLPQLPCESVKTISGGKTIFTMKVKVYRGQSIFTVAVAVAAKS